MRYPAPVPVECPHCGAELVRRSLRCKHCGRDARSAKESAECSVMLDLDGPIAREVAAELLAEPGRSPAEIEILQAIFDD